MVGCLLSPVHRRGNKCQNVYTTLPIALLLLAINLKHSSSQEYYAYSALEALATMHHANLCFTLHYNHCVQSLADKKVLMVLDRHASHKWLVATAYAPENSCDYDLPTTAFYIPGSYLMQPSVGSLCIWTTEDCIQCWVECMNGITFKEENITIWCWQVIQHSLSESSQYGKGSQWLCWLGS